MGTKLKTTEQCSDNVPK